VDRKFLFCEFDFTDDIALLTDFNEGIRKITLEIRNQVAAVGLHSM